MELDYHRRGSGDPLVLIHGVGSRWQVWHPVLDRLTVERDVIAIDLPRFGASPLPPTGTRARISTLARLVGELLDDLGLDRPHVAGNSLGGRLALELAKAGRARSVTALSPAGFNTTGERLFQRISLLAAFRLARVLRPVAAPLTATAAGRLLLSQYFARPWRIPPVDAADVLRAIAGATWFEETVNAMFEDTFTGGQLIDVPVTIAWGQRDRLFLLRQAPRAGAAVRGAKLVTLYGCGHVPTYDDPEQVARVVLDGSSATAGRAGAASFIN